MSAVHGLLTFEAPSKFPAAVRAPLEKIVTKGSHLLSDVSSELYSDAKVSVLVLEVMFRKLLEGNGGLPIQQCCGLAIILHYLFHTHPAVPARVVGSGIFDIAWGLHTRVSPPLKAQWWLTTSTVVDAISFQLAAAWCICMGITRLSINVVVSTLWWEPMLAESIRLMKLNSSAELSCRDTMAIISLAQGSTSILQFAAKYESMRPLFDSGLVEALTYASLNEFCYIGVSIATNASAILDMLREHDEGALGKGLSELEMELLKMKMSELKKRAVATGIADALVRGVDDTEDPKQAIIAILLEADGKEQLKRETFRRELTELKISQLKERAVAAGLDVGAINGVDEAEDPKEAIITILLSLETVGSAEGVGGSAVADLSPVQLEPSDSEAGLQRLLRKSLRKQHRWRMAELQSAIRQDLEETEATLAASLEQAADFMETLLLSTSRRVRPTVKAVCERVDSVLQGLDADVCRQVHRCDAATLDALCTAMIFVDGMVGGDKDLSPDDALSAVSALLDAIQRCGGDNTGEELPAEDSAAAGEALEQVTFSF